MLKKNIHFMILFLVIVGISIWTIKITNKNCSIETLYNELANARHLWVFLAFIFMAGFIIFEGMAIAKLVDGLCQKKDYIAGSLYSAADIYFSAITPSASGGQPASAYFMVKNGISAARTTVVLLVNLIMYSFALLFSGIIAVLFGKETLLQYDIIGKILIIVGAVVMLFLAFIFFMLLKKRIFIENIAIFLINLLGKIHLIRHPEKKIEKLIASMEQYQECAQAIKGKNNMLFVTFIYNLLQRVSQSLVTVCCYLATGGQMKNIFQVWTIHILTALGANCVPIPGGVGVTDYLLINGLEQVNDITNSANQALISRGISFYGCITLSILIIIIGMIKQKKKNMEE